MSDATLRGDSGGGFMPPRVVVIETTFPSRAAADACAARLVGDRLAACVQVEGPVASTYRWQQAIERAEEWRCVCKTAAVAAEACLVAIAAVHPYETPEVLISQREATPAYAAWVRQSVGRSD